MPAFPDQVFPLDAPAPTAAAPPPLVGARSGTQPGARLQPGLPAPEQLHPALWRAHQVGQQRGLLVASGFAALDAELPGGGWPARVLTELLLPHPGIGEIRLLAPALVAVQQAGRGVMLFNPPAALCAWTLLALGLDLAHLVLIQGAQPASAGPPTDMLWALEQALKSGHVGAMLAWLPARVRPDALRRLQLAAQAHDGPAFLLRELALVARPSAAALRLTLAPAGPDELALRIVKRRGPPLLQPLRLSLAPALSAPARARALRVVALPGDGAVQPAGAASVASAAAAAGHD